MFSSPAVRTVAPDSNSDAQIWPIINYFDPIELKINNSIIKCAENKRLVLAFKKHKNLGAFPTRSRFD